MPKVEAKQGIVNEIKSTIDGAASIILVDHRGLSVEQDTKLRKSLREANVTYKVYKNSMMNFAFEGTEFAALQEHLAGPSAIAISFDDPTAGPRVLATAAKDFKSIEFKAGVVEGIVYDIAGIKKIALIPPREELLSKLLGSLQAPISKFARTMKALAEKVEETGSATAGALLTDAPKAPEAKEEAVEEVAAKVAEEEVVVKEVEEVVAKEK
ncbi:MAG: 50S ribosomal protein L10, partial [Vallitaleaceae bacterium]|nr:50S ribosomal protein L10 [Vallitaleaceae bacterium]